MTPEKRVRVMGLIFVLLLIANLYRYWSGDLETPSLFEVEEGPELSERAGHALNEINSLPQLSFHFEPNGDQGPTPPNRNPFIYGIDRQEQARQNDLLRQMELARSEAAKSPERVESEPPPPSFEGSVHGFLQSHPNGERKLSVNFDGEPFLLRVGDTVGERYRLLQIDDNAVRFLRLSDQALIDVLLEPSE